MKKEIYAFLERHVDLYNCGQHDLDNSFIMGSPLTREELENLGHRSGGLVDEFSCWQDDHWMCTPLGICKENTHNVPGMRYIAMVYEDDRGNRYYVHVPGYWLEEYKVFDQGEEAMAIARDKYWDECETEDFGRPTTPTEEELDEVAEQLSKSELQNPDPAEHEEKQPEPEPEIEKVKYATKIESKPGIKIHKAYFTVDALHILEVAFDYMNEAGEIGTALGLQYVHEQLQRIAQRAIELDDPGLHIPMLLMHMYDGVDDLYGEVDKMKEKIKETEDQNG